MVLEPLSVKQHRKDFMGRNDERVRRRINWSPDVTKGPPVVVGQALVTVSFLASLGATTWNTMNTKLTSLSALQGPSQVKGSVATARDSQCRARFSFGPACVEVRGFHAREKQKGPVCAIVEGDLFLSARSSFFLLSSFSSSLTQNRALKLRFLLEKAMFFWRSPGSRGGRGGRSDKNRKKRKKRKQITKNKKAKTKRKQTQK